MPAEAVPRVIRRPPGGHPLRATGDVVKELTWSGPRPVGDVDAQQWIFTARLPRMSPGAGDELALELDGLATRCELRIGGELVLSSQSMHAAYTVVLEPRWDGAAAELTVLPLYDGVPSKPRARWRAALVEDGRLRWLRTTLLGRAPSFALGPPPVGPWRPSRVVLRTGVAVDAVDLSAQLDASGDGQVRVVADVRALDGQQLVGARVEVGADGSAAIAELTVSADSVSGAAAVLAPRLWWPRGYGDAHRYPVRLVLTTTAGEHVVDVGWVGFRRLENDPSAGTDGFAPVVNGVPVFVRGVVWVPGGDAARQLAELTAAGLNAIRVVGTGCYETPELHELCDEYGVLVWQDLMLANLDYPTQDDDFSHELEAEVQTVMSGLRARPSTVALCGGSEVEQQAAMLGLDPGLGRDPWLLQLMNAEAGDAIVVPNAPSGGALPFDPREGVANYYGVGGYRRPLSDARTSGVRFASECLALANVPDDDALLDEGVPRDRGADWDFADVRDHYLQTLFGEDPTELRAADRTRYAQLSREVSALLMAEVFGEWRRAESPSRGGFVLWSRDLVPGSGWGVLDVTGRPKAALRGLSTVWAPVAVWTVDEGLGGVDVHIANDGPTAVDGELVVELAREDGTVVDAARRRVTVVPHSVSRCGIEAVLGHFVDASYAYRFGPRGHDEIRVSFTGPDGTAYTTRRELR